MSRDFKCSLVQAAQQTDCTEVTFRGVMRGIMVGQWQTAVARVRDAYSKNGKEGAAEPKRRLPGVLFSGTFSKRAAAAIKTHSGAICVDLDNLNGTLDQIKEHICSDPHTLAAFVSPTGSGLKVVLLCDPAKPHAESFRAAEHHFKTTFGLEIDEACKDVSRLCFVSHDPEAFVADDALPLPYPPPEPVEFRPRVLGLDERPGDHYDRTADVPALLRKHGWTESGKEGWTRPGKDHGLSATWNHVPGRFHVFTSSTQFEANHDYKPWHLYAIFEHGGDYSAAAKALAEAGFGAQNRQERMLERLAGPKPPDHPAAQSAEKRDFSSKRVRLVSPPPEPTTRLFLAGKPVCTPGNLTTIIAKSKTGKTASLGAAVAAIIGAHYDRRDLDTFKFTAPHNKEAVVLIDTEQSPFDAWTCHKRMMDRAGNPEEPSWLHHYAMVGESARDLRLSLPVLLDQGRSETGGVFMLILDGVADFVASVNDEAECNDFIAALRKLSVDFNCPIVCVIHSNEGVKSGDDGRGHLGKQLTRKAESNLLLKKVGEVTTITSDKQRKAPITEADSVAFRWSEAEQRHVSCQSQEDSKRDARRDQLFDIIESVMEHLGGKKRARYSEIVKGISEVRRLSAARAEAYFTEMKRLRILDKDIVGNWEVLPK